MGIKKSSSFVREPEGAGVAEHFIRILKENPLRIRGFRNEKKPRLAQTDRAAVRVGVIKNAKTQSECLQL